MKKVVKNIDKRKNIYIDKRKLNLACGIMNNFLEVLLI